MLTNKEYVNKAVNTKLGLTIKYLNNDGETTVRKLSDIEFADTPTHHYIRAFCHLRKEYRTFKVSRIVEVDSLFYSPNDFLNYPEPSRVWRAFGEEYTLKEVWAATNPGLYNSIQGDIADVIGIQFADGSESYRIKIPLKSGQKKELKIGSSNLDEGDQVRISSIIGQDYYKRGYSDTISFFRYDGDIISTPQRDWIPYDEEYNLEDIWDAYIPGLYEQIDGKYAKIKAIEFSNGVAYLRILVPLKDGSSFELKLSSNSSLKDGDDVWIPSIVGQEFHKRDCTPIVRYDGKNANVWTSFGEKLSLKEIWEKTNPGLYEKIEGNLADVIVEECPNGRLVLRIKISFNDGHALYLSPSVESYLEEGDKVLISTITGQKYHKKGFAPVIFYDGDYL